ncbi:MAG: methyltransferase family protein [Tepidisphaeraceae bacterium]
MPALAPYSWPALLVGLILLAYWLRVVQMVRRTRRRTGRDANFVPPEKLGRVLRMVWAPVVMFWVVLPILGAYWPGGPFPFRPLFDETWVDWSALCIAIVAFALTWVCWRNMGTSWRMGIDPAEKTRLVFTGPFAYVRHPIYGLSSVLMLMTMLIVASPAMIVVGALHLALLQWEVAREEVYLVAAHGDPYRDYQRQVGRFFPRSVRAYQPRNGDPVPSPGTPGEG